MWSHVEVLALSLSTAFFRYWKLHFSMKHYTLLVCVFGTSGPDVGVIVEDRSLAGATSGPTKKILSQTLMSLYFSFIVRSQN